MITNGKILCRCVGGSNLYGLQTPTSDYDERGVWISTDPYEIFGLKTREFVENRKDGADEFYNELKHAIKLLRGANTTMIELLFNQRWLEVAPEWIMLQDNKYKLIDSEKLYSCLRGYMQGELKLANGERTGKLGGKRKEAIMRYSYSPKNFTQLFRLSWAGQHFFLNGVFPEHIPTYSESFANHLLDIKTKPERFTKDQLNEMARISEDALTYAFNNRKTSYKFDEDFALEFCRTQYSKIILSL